MFTGLVSCVGQVVKVEARGAPGQSGFGKWISVAASRDWLEDLALGDSICVQGACMTIADLSAGQFSFDVSAESLRLTEGLDKLVRVNLEKSLAAGDRMGGHIVSGHVDGLGLVTHFAQVGESWELRILAPLSLAKYLAYKGSITVNGVSLTVNQVQDLAGGAQISINLIPHTLSHTSLGDLKEGAAVNLEIDTIARYVERMLGAGLAGSNQQA